MTLSVRLPQAVEARLDRLARVTGRPKSWYVREAIEANLDELEDLYLAEQVSIRVRAGQERTWTHDEIVRDLDLAD